MLDTNGKQDCSQVVLGSGELQDAVFSTVNQEYSVRVYRLAKETTTQSLGWWVTAPFPPPCKVGSVKRDWKSLVHFP